MLGANGQADGIGITSSFYYFVLGNKNVRESKHTPGRHMGKEVPSAKRNHGRSGTPGHMVSSGIAHSSKAKVSSQKFHKIALHSGSRSSFGLKPTERVGL